MRGHDKVSPPQALDFWRPVELALRRRARIPLALATLTVWGLKYTTDGLLSPEAPDRSISRIDPDRQREALSGRCAVAK